MKKQILLSFATLSAISMVAQHAYRKPSNLSAVKMNTTKQVISDKSFAASAVQTNKFKGTKKVAASTYQRFTGSMNLYGVIATETRAVQYNKDLNLVGFIHRRSPNWTGISAENSTSAAGTIAFSWSSNNGSTWDSTIMAASTTAMMRYPAGSIYNPAGNSTIANAYAVGSGPYHPGSNWIGNYFTSKELNMPGDKNVTDLQLRQNGTAGVIKTDFARVDFQVTSNNRAHVLSGLYTDINATTAAAQGWRGVAIHTATLSATGTPTWAVTDSIKPSFKMDSSGNQDAFGLYNMTWSDDGQTGYVIMSGVDANATAGTSQNSYQLMVWKSTDAGATWARHAPLFDWTTIPAINDKLFAVSGSSPAYAKPFMSLSEGNSATVDYQGNLHYLCTIVSSASDNSDSLGYTFNINYNNTWTYIYDCISTSSGWNAVLIDSLNTENASGNSSYAGYAENNWSSPSGGSGNDKVSQDARLQISRTHDGKFVFFGWADSDTNIVGSHFNIYPDIFMRGYDLVNNKMTCVKNITKGTSAEISAYFMFISPTTMDNASTSFTIPATYSTNADKNGDEAVDHFYINDATFHAADFSITPGTPGCLIAAGIKENTGLVNHLNCYPNPAANATTVSVTLKENAKMDVVIMNNMGQQVYSTHVDAHEGVNNVDISLNNFSSGIYFYQVKVENSKPVTKKLVIQK